MSTEAMVAFLKSCGPQTRIELQVATQCAPVLKGIKASNLMVGKPGIWGCIRDHLQKSRIVCGLLYADAKREVLLLYRYEHLEQLLRTKQVQQFLSRYEYSCFEVGAVLGRVRIRYQRHLGLGAEFPHELGVLLGYPIDDVEGFIQNKGKNSLAERYWKVYHNCESAQAMFQRYDEARNQAMEEIARGYSLAQIAV